MKKVHPVDLARGCSDIEMTWLLCCAGAATEDETIKTRQNRQFAMEVQDVRHVKHSESDE